MSLFRTAGGLGLLRFRLGTGVGLALDFTAEEAFCSPARSLVQDVSISVYSRGAARLLALVAGSWHNWLIGAPAKRSFIAYDR